MWTTSTVTDSGVTHVIVEARAVGQRRRLVDPVVIEGHEPIGSVRDLLEFVVHREVDLHNDRSRQHGLIRVLTPGQVAEGAAAGKVDPEAHLRQVPTDAGAAVATAVEAFSDGVFFVFVDGSQVQDLDSPIDVTSDTPVRFVRLVALAGG